MEVLYENERNSPECKEQKLLPFLCLQHNLIRLYKVKHSEEGTAMHPSGQNLHIEGSNVPWIDDAFIEEYPQTPEPDHHDGLQRESYQVEAGEELASRVG